MSWEKRSNSLRSRITSRKNDDDDDDDDEEEKEEEEDVRLTEWCFTQLSTVFQSYYSSHYYVFPGFNQY